ncbi:MAG: hypothetical protein GKR94_14545 [Gammaproteobacteria bacterium]|nr:hypothetical protein [Gammaproteobacteria bacterium]
MSTAHELSAVAASQALAEEGSVYRPQQWRFMRGYKLSRLCLAGVTLIESYPANAWNAQRLAEAGAQVARSVRYGASLTVRKVALAAECIRLVRAAGEALFGQAELICSSVAPSLPVRTGEAAPADQADFTALANILGAPALSLPAGISTSGLPIGVQLVPAPDRDRWLLEVAKGIDELLTPLR